jgi:hypothetical protein
MQKSVKVLIVEDEPHALMVLTRDDARLAEPLEAIRKATAERMATAPQAAPPLMVPKLAPAQ